MMEWMIEGFDTWPPLAKSIIYGSVWIAAGFIFAGGSSSFGGTVRVKMEDGLRIKFSADASDEHNKDTKKP